MHEHDEATLVTYLRDVIKDRGQDVPLADDLLDEMRDVLAMYEAGPGGGSDGSPAQCAFDAAQWRRILRDPDLPNILVSIEDRLLFD